MKRSGLLLSLLLMPSLAFAAGYGVFTQGASGLGQANAVVAHPTGPSSLYFNPALLNDVPGRQVEVGTTAIYAKREIDLDSGASEEADSDWQFPSSFYYTHNDGDRFAAGIGVFFPFGLANEWDDDYEGRYIGTSGEMFSMNINPAISVKITDQLSLAAGVDCVYIDADFRTMVNQSALLGGLPVNDVEQKFTGDGWGYGFNLGALYKVADRVSIGAAYRSKVDVDLEGDVDYDGDIPLLSTVFVDGSADTEIKLPAQFVIGVATKITDDLIVEVGARWEDWDVNDTQTLELDNPLLGQSTIPIERNWNSTWTYNIGGQYRVSDTIKINAGYLYGENPVPDSTFEPVIPDSDAHLFTIGTDLTYGQWTVSGALGYEYHETREKDNDLDDPLGTPGTTANGNYDTDIYLVGLSVGYKF